MQLTVAAFDLTGYFAELPVPPSRPSVRRYLSSQPTRLRSVSEQAFCCRLTVPQPGSLRRSFLHDPDAFTRPSPHDHHSRSTTQLKIIEYFIILPLGYFLSVPSPQASGYPVIPSPTQLSPLAVCFCSRQSPIGTSEAARLDT